MILLLCTISKKYETKICSSKNFSKVYEYEINECEYLIVMFCKILDVDIYIYNKTYCTPSVFLFSFISNVLKFFF